MPKCNCSICKITNIVTENFKPTDVFSRQVTNIHYALEIISNDLSLLSSNAADGNVGVISDDSLSILKERFDNEIFNSNFMSNADMNLCNQNQAIIFKEYNSTLKLLATGAATFIETALVITDLQERMSFVANSGINVILYTNDCLKRISSGMLGVVAPQLS